MRFYPQHLQETTHMATLYVQEQGTTVRKRAQQVVITRENKTLQAVPLNKVDQVVLMGPGVQLSTALLVELLGRGVPVTLTNESGSRHYATLTAGPSRFVELRLRQMQRAAEPDWALDLARSLVRAKLVNQRALLTVTGWPTAAAEQIAAATSGLDSASSADALRGHEGAGAAAYFAAWRIALAPSWGFHGRAFHPPPDPVNALLSFAYTLLMNDLLTAIHLVGLDPYLGVFHTPEAGRPSLALDLMEPFRPLAADRCVLDLLHEGQLRRDQFAPSSDRPGGVDLSAESRALLIARYETMMQAPTQLPSGERTALRRAILLQVQAVARAIRGEQAAATCFQQSSL